MKLKPFFSMPEIAEVLGVHRSRAKAKLLLMHIPVNLIGRSNVVYLSAIQLNNPDFYLSLLEYISQNTTSL